MGLHYSLSKLKLRLFFKIFDILDKSNRIIPPNFAVWDCTKRCNLNCIHCGSQGTYQEELSTSEIKDIIKEIALLGTKAFQITGGEPLLRQDLLEVLSYAKKVGLKTTIATNGYFIDEQKTKELLGAGVSLIQISVDGTRNIHNFIRGNLESFDRAVNAIKLIRENDTSKVAASTIIMPQNIETLGQLKEILSSLGVEFWNIGTVMPEGRAKDNASLFLTREQFISLLKFIRTAKKDMDIELGENFTYLGAFEKNIRITPKICPAGLLSFCIGVDGYVRGCSDQPDIEFYREGSIREKTIEDIWKKGFKRYRDRRIVKEDKKCGSCTAKNGCLGGCWVMRENNLHCILDYMK